MGISILLDFFYPLPKIQLQLRSVWGPDHCSTLALEVTNRSKASDFSANATIVGTRNLWYSLNDPPRWRYKMPWIGHADRRITIEAHRAEELEVAHIVKVEQDGGNGEIDINGIGPGGYGNATRDAWTQGSEGPKPEFDLSVQIYQAGIERPLNLSIGVEILKGPEYLFNTKTLTIL